MSTTISVDDLVASFSANHIGQEAIDLAALQVSQDFPVLLLFRRKVFGCGF